MNLHARPYQSDEDTWRIRQLLREVFMLNNRRELNWQVYRFDYWRWHSFENIEGGSLENKVFLWETPEGGLAAVLNPEGTGNAFMHVHPAYQSDALTVEMIETAEQRLARPGEGGRKLVFWVNVEDARARRLLAQLGYVEHPDKGEYLRRRSLADPIPERQPAEGYTIRSLGGPEELLARSWASWRGFHPDEPDEKYEGWEWYRNIQRAPLYRRDLDIVAVAPGGEIASFCTAWFDDVTRTGAFEPVATVPEHARRGLAAAVMCEGMRRLKRLGATLATVGSYSEPAHTLYASVGFRDFLLSTPWEKPII